MRLTVGCEGCVCGINTFTVKLYTSIEKLYGIIASKLFRMDRTGTCVAFIGFTATCARATRALTADAVSLPHATHTDAFATDGGSCE